MPNFCRTCQYHLPTWADDQGNVFKNLCRLQYHWATGDTGVLYLNHDGNCPYCEESHA